MAKGESVTLEVEATGDPAPKAEWFKNGIQLIDSSDFHVRDLSCI